MYTVQFVLVDQEDNFFLIRAYNVTLLVKKDKQKLRQNVNDDMQKHFF